MKHLTPVAGYLFFALWGTTVSAQSLPPIQLNYASTVHARDGRLLGYIGKEHRVELRSTGSVAPVVIHALLATEDRDFYNHDGVSMKGLGRALWHTLTGSPQGGSTLTMQLARNLFLSHERTVGRKITEINYARELEKRYSKDQILLLYLNTVYFGRSAYGIWAAAQEYYSKTPDQLSPTEAALLVGLLQAPSAYDPVKHPDRAIKRRNEVLHNLLEVGRISQQQFTSYRQQPLGLNLRPVLGLHFLEHVRREASVVFQSRGKSLLSDAIRITTTLMVDLQHAAESAVRSQWEQFPQQMKDAQAGFVSVDVRTGAIRAMVGGTKQSEWRGLNRAMQIRRQPGSAFKPFLYGSILAQGYSLGTPYPDAPLVVDSGTAWEWRPMNNEGTWSGNSVSMAEGIRRSLNLVAAHAVMTHTSADSVIAFARRCGISSPLRAFPSIALGTSEVSPIDMASAFAVFASGGSRCRPYAITDMTDRNGSVVYRGGVDTARVLDVETASIITDALRAVVDSGTAMSIRRWYNGAAAGKTGTSQNFADAWFVGFTPSLSTAVWIGFDDPSKKLSGAFRFGGTAAAPIWARFSASAPPDSTFGEAEAVLLWDICVDSGDLATATCPRKRSHPVNVFHLPIPCSEHDPIFLPVE